MSDSDVTIYPFTFLIPNEVLDLGLSVYAFRLYGHRLRLIQDGIDPDGETIRETASICKMSVGSVSKAKKELRGRGLLVDRAADKSGYVYLIKAVPFSDYVVYKIGHTNNPKDRLGWFAVKLPFEIETIHLIACKDRFAAERHLHERFAGNRVNGEWFSLRQQDIDEIKAIITL